MTTHVGRIYMGGCPELSFIYKPGVSSSNLGNCGDYPLAATSSVNRNGIPGQARRATIPSSTMYQGAGSQNYKDAMLFDFGDTLPLAAIVQTGSQVGLGDEIIASAGAMIYTDRIQIAHSRTSINKDFSIYTYSYSWTEFYKMLADTRSVSGAAFGNAIFPDINQEALVAGLIPNLRVFRTTSYDGFVSYHWADGTLIHRSWGATYFRSVGIDVDLWESTATTWAGQINGVAMWRSCIDYGPADFARLSAEFDAA